MTETTEVPSEQSVQTQSEPVKGRKRRAPATPRFRPEVLDELITGIDAGAFGDPSWLALRLTWTGNDFIELARPEQRWRKAMETTVQRGAALTLEVLAGLLRQYMMGG